MHVNCYVTQRLSTLQAAEKFKAPQPAPVIPEAKAAAIEQEEESEEEEVCETHAIARLLNCISPIIHEKWYFGHPSLLSRAFITLSVLTFLVTSSPAVQYFFARC